MYVFAMIGLTHSMIMCLWASSVRLEYEKVFNLKTARIPGISGYMMTIIYKSVKCLGLKVALLTCATFIASIVVLLLGCPVFSMAMSGTTMLEVTFPMKEYVEIRPEVFVPLGPGFYSLDCFANLRVILGEHWCLRLLIPFRQGVFDISPAVHPVPSIRGVCALRQVGNQVDQTGAVCRVPSYEKLGFNPGPGRRAPAKEV